MEFVQRLPDSVEVCWYFFEDGDFARSIRGQFRSVTIVEMSKRVASVERQKLSLRALGGVFDLVWRLARELSAARPDVVLTNSMKAHIIGSLAAKFTRRICVNYVHDIIEGPALMLLRVISGLCSAERLTCSRAVKKQLGLPRTSVAYAAIDVKTFEALPDRRYARLALGIPDEGLPVVGIVGRIARWKRQDQFIRIAARLTGRVNAHFCIIGSPIFGVDGDYVKELEDMVDQAKLRDRVHFIPWQLDMRLIYAALDLSCNCSAREPFGRTSLEALASGVPIVCFDDAGICEVFEQHAGGTRVPAGDEIAFSEAVLTYLTDPGARAAASAAAQAAAQPLDSRFAFPTFLAALNRVSSQPIAAAAGWNAAETLSAGK